MNFLEFLTLPARERREELGNFAGSMFETVFGTPEEREATRQKLRQPPSGGYTDIYQNSFLARNRNQTPFSVQFLKDYGDFMPVIGDFAGVADVAQELTSEEPNYPLAGALGLATAVGAVPYAGDLAARGISSGARSLFDVASRIEVDPSTVGMNLGNVRIKPKTETREGEKIFQALQGQPTAPEFMGSEPLAPMSNVTNVKSQKNIALQNHESIIRGTGELKKPTQIDIDQLEGSTLLAIVGDNTGRHNVLSVGGEVFDTPVESLAGFQYIDVDNPLHGYAGARPATSAKLNEAQKIAEAGGDPVYISFLMGEKSGDFADHTGATYGKMFANSHARIDPKDYETINEKIRNIGVPKSKPKLDGDGNQIFKANGNPAMDNFTEYPFRNFEGINNPNAIFEYMASLPTGTQRAYFLKGLDKANLFKLGMPKVQDARLAVADSAQLGMDWGTMGYRLFRPDIERGLIETTPEMHKTYDTGVGKVGPSMSLLGRTIEEGANSNPSKGIPANLLMSDLSEGQRLKGTGGGLLMSSPDYKVYEGSTAKAVQKVEPVNVDTVNTFLEVEKTQGRDRAYQFAQKVLSAGKVTNELIKQAKKMNAPTWVVALMVSQQAMQGDE